MNAIRISWDRPFFDPQQALDIGIADLDAFYAETPEAERANLFFVLLHSLNRCMETGEKEGAAHLSFLIAYYLFTTLTPPGSQELALHYIRQATEINPCRKYMKLLELIQKGN